MEQKTEKRGPTIRPVNLSDPIEARGGCNCDSCEAAAVAVLVIPGHGMETHLRFCAEHVAELGRITAPGALTCRAIEREYGVGRYVPAGLVRMGVLPALRRGRALLILRSDWESWWRRQAFEGAARVEPARRPLLASSPSGGGDDKRVVKSFHEARCPNCAGCGLDPDYDCRESDTEAPCPACRPKERAAIDALLETAGGATEPVNQRQLIIDTAAAHGITTDELVRLWERA